jgi:hypothetical protein
MPLFAGPAGNADLAGGHHGELSQHKLISVIFQYGIEVVDFGLKAGARETKEYNAVVCLFLLENESSEIAVGNYEDAALLPGDYKDVLIGKTVRIIA